MEAVHFCVDKSLSWERSFVWCSSHSPGDAACVKLGDILNVVHTSQWQDVESRMAFEAVGLSPRIAQIGSGPGGLHGIHTCTSQREVVGELGM